MRAALLLIASLFIFQGMTFGQAQRRVMVESFTQASCGPCAAQNPGFNQLVFNNWSKVVLLKYQTSWPGYDPMNLQNPDEVAARVTYYGVTGVPNVRIDGSLDAGTSGSVTAAQINNAYAATTPLEMELTHHLNAALDSVFISGVIRNVSDTEFSPANTVLHVAIMEQELLFPEPPGSTNETDFYCVMRKMLPDVNGMPLSAIAAGDSLEFEYNVPLPDYIYSYPQVGAVAFVQTNGSRQVHQAAISEAPGMLDGYADVALELTSQGPAGLCDYSLTPSVEITNATSTEVTEMEVELSINGGAPTSQTWTGTLAEGESTTITFEQQTVSPGATEVAFNLASVNGAADINQLNQLVSSQTFYTLNDSPVGTEIVQGFETTPNLATPANTLLIKDADRQFGVVNQSYLQGIGATAPGAVGGFAASAKSIMVDFYTWNDAGAQASMTFEKIDLSTSAQPVLAFEHAYAQYQSFSDRLTIAVSQDCGDTWTTVWNKAGSQLSTTPATTSFFVPNATQWVADTVDLSAYAEAPELLVRFTATSDYGNNLYIDNINLVSLLSGADEPGLLEGKVFAYPNPASDLVNIDFQLVESSRLDISIFDISGKLVQTLVGGEQYSAGAHKVLWQPQQSGLYLVRLATENGAVTKRVTVVR
ncbi:MAG: T9SS type A sorting domain-containing protein [Phaeodactylibacter sp.]|nr:T9SS type A sorting domain-containing protein [Phaeodactylibacter sp.]MCB9272962.1 T9SS type A sorting domain-containing protein [Lewinellaceae bacterium]